MKHQCGFRHRLSGDGCILEVTKFKTMKLNRGTLERTPCSNSFNFCHLFGPFMSFICIILILCLESHINMEKAFFLSLNLPLKHIIQLVGDIKVLVAHKYLEAYNHKILFIQLWEKQLQTNIANTWGDVTRKISKLKEA